MDRDIVVAHADRDIAYFKETRDVRYDRFLSLTAFHRAEVNFGRVIGIDTVNVVVPLNNIL